MSSEKKKMNHVKHYQADAAFFDYFRTNRFQTQENRRRYETLLHLCKPGRGDRILEIGSGGAPGMSMIEKTGARYVPLDVAVENLIPLNASKTELSTPCCGDIYRLPFRNESFHVIILSEVLEHLENQEQPLAEIYRVLVSGGRLVVSVPYKEKLSYQVCIHCHRSTPTNGHLHSYDFPVLRELVEKSGYRVIKIQKQCNKVLNRLHFYVWMRQFPFPLWRCVDRLFNGLIDKAASMVLLARK